jgi:hypothetical protein
VKAESEETNINTEMQVSNLDHLGIVAGVIDEMELWKRSTKKLVEVQGKSKRR